MPNDTYPKNSSTDGAWTAQPLHERVGEERRYDGSVAYEPPRDRYRPPRYVRWIAGLLVTFVALALVCASAGAVLTYLAFNSGTATSTVDRSFHVSGVPTLAIHSAVGSVHVNTGAIGQITLHADLQVRALSHAQAQSEVNDIHVTTTQTGDVVNIQVDAPDTALDNRQIDLTVTAPSATNLAVIEDAGSIDASGFTGKITVRLNAGHATLSEMQFATGSTLRVNSGNLTVDGALQPHASLLINVNAGSADVTLPENTSAHLNATASAGSVNVNGWNVTKWRSEAGTVSVNSDLNPNPTGVITIQVAAGRATLNAA